MGADGHIEIFDFDKACRELGIDEPERKVFQDIISSSITYFQQFEGRRLITDYWGDNIWSHSSLSQINERGWDPNYWDDSWRYNFILEQCEKYGMDRDRLKEIVDYLYRCCRITQWEVWT